MRKKPAIDMRIIIGAIRQRPRRRAAHPIFTAGIAMAMPAVSTHKVCGNIAASP